jgi:CIC family chloride channel protein
MGGHLIDLGRRSREVVVLSAITGAIVGLLVAAFERITADGLLAEVDRLPVAAQAVAPIAGLVLCALALRLLAHGANPSTSDEYIRNFHQPDRRLDLSPVPGRITGAIVTLGLGGALGLEGPATYLGAATGSALQRRFRDAFSPAAGKVLMVAGAAAGVAAIFKAPATGTVFALEVPYQDDTARRMLLPALVASATGYLAFVGLNGTEPLFPSTGSPPFALRELGGALLLGLLCGGLARLFSIAVRAAKRLQEGVPVVPRLAVAGTVLAGAFVAARAATSESLTIGPGYRVIDWVRGSPSLTLVALVLGLRAVATVATVAGGGAGGLFIPLVLLGALTGQLVGGALGETTTTLFPVIGIAAFLGAGYRTPLSAVMFVAESTGRPGFVVPGLLAAAVSQLVMGDASVSSYQETGQLGHLERRFRLPLTAAIRADVSTAPPDVTLEDVVFENMLLTRHTTVCVVDETRYQGVVRLDDLGRIPRDEWSAITVGAVARDDAPRAQPDWRLEDALEAMQRSGLDMLPVVSEASVFVGVVTLNDIVRLDQILRSTDDARQTGTRSISDSAGRSPGSS